MRINSVSVFGSCHSKASVKKNFNPSFSGQSYTRFTDLGDKKDERDYPLRENGVNLYRQIHMIGKRPLELLDGAIAPNYMAKGPIYCCDENEYSTDKICDDSSAIMDFILNVDTPKTMRGLDLVTKYRCLENLIGFRNCIQADLEYYKGLSNDVEGYVERYYGASPKMRYTPLKCEDKNIEQRKKDGEEFLRTHTKEEVTELERTRILTNCVQLAEVLQEANNRIYKQLLVLINAGFSDERILKEGFTEAEIAKYREIAKEAKDIQG